MANTILSTSNYKIFKKMIGNRDISELQVQRLVKLIKSNGYFTNPILVNERMEVIDGQHRLEALKELGMPVDYIIIKGADASYCQFLNWGHKNWSIRTFIKHRSDLGDGNYKLLECLLASHPKINNQIILAIAMTPPRFFGANTSDYLSGRLELSRMHYEWSEQLLTRFEPIYESIKHIETYKQGMYGASLFALTIPKVDESRLLKVISSRSVIRTDGTSKGCIDAVDQLYNHALSTRRVDIVGAFKSKEHITSLVNEWKREHEEWQKIISNRTEKRR